MKGIYIMLMQIKNVNMAAAVSLVVPPAIYFTI